MSARNLLFLSTFTATLIACAETPTPPPAPMAEAPAPAAAVTPSYLHDLGAMVIPADNPQTDAKVKLGHQLFFDSRLSKDGSRSCYSCHLNEDGNGGHDPIAVGAGGKVLTRHSPVIWNVGYLGAYYWDGRSDSLEAQATAAWAGGNMGVGKENLGAKAAEIAAVAGYAAQFNEVFPGEGVTPTTIVKALSAYERTLVCDNTAFDRFAKGDAAALDEAQRAGLELFMGKAACASCHAPPHFSIAYGGPGVYFNVGIGTQSASPESVDVGRMSVTKAESDWASYKIPSLRNVAKSAPYFHDGSVADLKGAVRLMAAGGLPNKNLSPLMVDRGLTDAEIDAVVAFLGALDCGKGLEQPVLP